MRNSRFLVTLLALVATLVQAQAPTTLNYQGRLLQNTADQDAATGTVEIRFSIWTGPATEGTATELWNETWTDVALSNGIFSVLLGSNGSPLDPADFQADDSLFLQLEVDGETLSPRQQLGSAPFAFVDEPANELQELLLTNNELSLSSSATTVDLSPYLDDTDTTVDNQQLSLSGNTLQLSSDDGADMVDLAESTTIAELVSLTNLDRARTVFVTSEVFDGDFGGLDGADNECQRLANAAGLSGVFQAWLSDVTGSPSTRFDREGFFELVDGTPIASGWADLTDGTIDNPINITELGVATTESAVWSNVNGDGTLRGSAHCTTWTGSGFGAVGLTTATDESWTDEPTVADCATDTLPIYCFEQIFEVSNQMLSLVDTDLTLTSIDGIDTVDLSSFLDNTDNQVLSLNGTNLELTSDDGIDTVDLSPYLDNTDNQVLSLSGTALQLTSDDGTDAVDLTAFLDDTDAQDLSLSVTTLSLTNDATPVDLSAFLDNTDAQTLSLAGDTLEISGSASSVDLATADVIVELLARVDRLVQNASRTVFASSIGTSGAIGGLTGADAFCQTLANTAGLDGTYMAWLSDNTGNPRARFTQGDAPFWLVDGTKIADDWADLTDGTLDAPINLDENGNSASSPNSDVWTNTTTSGDVDSSVLTCNNWTTTGSVSFVGRLDRTDSGWTKIDNILCNRNLILYCFEQ